MTCPRCQTPLVPVTWTNSATATDKPPLRTAERFDRCPVCGWQSSFAVCEEGE